MYPLFPTLLPRRRAAGQVAGALIAATVAWPLAAGAAPVTIADTTDVMSTLGGTPYGCCGFVNGWGDAVQDANRPYNTDRVVFDRVDATHATIQIFTQFNGYESIGGGKAVHYADLFIDTGAPGTPGGLSYGIALGFQGGADGNGGLSTPGLYQITETTLSTTNGNSQVRTSQDVWNGRGGWIVGGAYAPQNDHAQAALAPTVLTGGIDQNWDVSVSVVDPDGEPYAPGPSAAVATSGLYALTVSLSAPDLSAMQLVLNDFDLFWGTGDCDNDAVWGIITAGANERLNAAPTPEPPGALFLLGGLALIALRRIRIRG
jgi:MYXO-CTERM domain-containing protein